MAEVKKQCYKYCIVPMCRSTTIKNPNKVFFCVPNNIKMRKKWCQLMKRHVIGPKSSKYVCEDHFDIENDTDNLFKYRLVGGSLRLKPGSYPHKFDCQKSSKPQELCGAHEKRRRIEFYEKLLTKDVPSTSSQSSAVGHLEMNETDVDESVISDTEDPLPEAKVKSDDGDGDESDISETEYPLIDDVIECDVDILETIKTEDPLPDDITFIEPDNGPKMMDKGVQVNIKCSQQDVAVQTIVKRNKRGRRRK